MSRDDNLKLVRRALDEFVNKGNGRIADELFSADYVWHPGDIAPTMDREMHVIDNGELRKAFPDLKLTILDMVADGDKVTTHFSATGTHKGPLVDRVLGGITHMGTGKKVAWKGMTVHRIADGKIAEGWLNYDRAGFQRQLMLGA